MEGIAPIRIKLTYVRIINSEGNVLSPTAEAIRHYKLNASGGYAKWSKVLCTDDYRMHVPSMGFDVVGPLEVEEIIFGWLTDIGAKQELVKIIEFGSYVTCYLLITHKDGAYST